MFVVLDGRSRIGVVLEKSSEGGAVVVGRTTGALVLSDGAIGVAKQYGIDWRNQIDEVETVSRSGTALIRKKNKDNTME